MVEDVPEAALVLPIDGPFPVLVRLGSFPYPVEDGRRRRPAVEYQDRGFRVPPGRVAEKLVDGLGVVPPVPI